MAKEGLTGTDINSRGHLGQNPVFSRTRTGRDMVLLDVASTPNNPALNKLTLWWKCVGYGDMAEVVRKLSLKKGDYVRVFGWLDCEGERDETGRLKYYEGKPVQKVTLVLTDIGHGDKSKVERQLALSGVQG